MGKRRIALSSQPSVDVETRSFAIPVEGGSVAVRMHLPRHQRIDARLLWIHGGAFVGGSLDGRESDSVAHSFASAGIAVLCVDYRHVPPFSKVTRWRSRAAVRFPTPIDDCLAGWAHLDSAEDATDAPLFVGGASAGGNLAAMSILRAADRGLAPPVGVILSYPLLDHTAPTPHRHERRIAVTALLGVAQRVWVSWMGRVFVGVTSEHSVDDAFPREQDLPDFPPSLIITAEKDLLRFSGESFADKLRRAGARVDIRTEPGTRHGYLIRPDTPAYARSLNAFVEWMKNI
ncbi:alpha/beta hydrolase fold domain-containing protein [Rhodococcus fascians]|nr:alpha/beta hydrolase fold domain-containing protein [Rhodococcus fascians]